MQEEVFWFPSEKAEYRLVLLHGWGAEAEDLMPLGRLLIEGIDKNIQLVSFRAPIDHPEGIGRQWYSLFPPDWIEAEKSVLDLKLRLENLAKLDIPLEKTVLLGFSQGAAMAIASGFKLPLAGIVACSGYVHKNFTFPKKVPPVFLSHGNNDSVVPVNATKELVKVFDQNSIIHQRVFFDGGHEISQEIYIEIEKFMKKCFLVNK